jgi:hypothetical protein
MTAVEIYKRLVNQGGERAPEAQAILVEVELRKTLAKAKPAKPDPVPVAADSAPNWRQEALHLVKGLRLQLAARNADEKVRNTARDLVAHLKAKYNLAGDRVARKRQRVRLAQLVQEQGGLVLAIDQRSQALHIRLDQVRNETLRLEIRRRAAINRWTLDEEGDLCYELPKGRSDRMAETMGQQKWLHDLWCELNPPPGEGTRT